MSTVAGWNPDDGWERTCRLLTDRYTNLQEQNRQLKARIKELEHHLGEKRC